MIAPRTQGASMRTLACTVLLMMLIAAPALARNDDIPKSISASVGDVLQFAQQQFRCPGSLHGWLLGLVLRQLRFQEGDVPILHCCQFPIRLPQRAVGSLLDQPAIELLGVRLRP